MNGNLTKKEAYLAMFSFLEDYYLRTKSDAIGSILSGLCLLEDDLPMDQAYWSEWEAAIEKAKSGKVDTSLRFEPPSSDA